MTFELAWWEEIILFVSVFVSFIGVGFGMGLIVAAALKVVFLNRN